VEPAKELKHIRRLKSLLIRSVISATSNMLLSAQEAVVVDTCHIVKKILGPTRIGQLELTWILGAGYSIHI
jgi:hypothetical protein